MRSFLFPTALLTGAFFGAAGYVCRAAAGDAKTYVPIKAATPQKAKTPARKTAPAKATPKHRPQPTTTSVQPPAANVAADVKVDYIKEVHPLLQKACGGCHLNGQSQGGLRLDSREQILRGGKSGPAAIVGDSDKSLLIKLVAGHDPDRRMPLGGDPLTAKQVALLRAWIDQGLSFSARASTVEAAPSKSAYRPALEPRRPKLPPVRSGTSPNPIDRLLEPYFKTHKIQPKPVVDERTYARRVYLDIIGVLPSPGDLDAFAADARPGKRDALAARLLADNQSYAEHWLSFWNDALRNDYAGTGYIDGGRQQITSWLYNALLTNKPYDRFVAELLNPTPESEGFIKGIVWRGTVNASQTPPMQAAQNISQVFLGVNMKCASCHDSFINDWKLSDAYGLAGIYADGPLEMVRCDIPTGKTAPVKFLYPQLGAIEGAAPRAERLKQLAAIMTGKGNGRLARTIVNRLWARFMGRGFIEPTDEMDNPPWNADLLDWLASDFADNGYDLKRLIRLIVTSRAYQMPPVGAAAETTTKFRFSGPLVRRMSAEQFADAVSSLTGVWPQTAAARIGSSDMRVPAKWIWNDANATKAVSGGQVYFRKTVNLPSQPSQAIAVMSCDNECALYVNGKRVGANEDWMKPTSLDLAPYLVAGRNVLAVQAINWPDAESGKGLSFSGPSPAGFVFFARLGKGENGQAEGQATAQEIGSDAGWLASGVKSAGWEQPGFVPEGWKPAVELGEADTPPWSLQAKLAEALQHASSGRLVRAALVTANPLTTALGRPNREQVVTARPAAATTLQSLELSNGRTLASLLQQGAARWMAEPRASDRDLIARIFSRALGRQPTNSEMQTAQTIIGSPVRTEGIEDLLWVITMLPEFQLIY